MSTSQQNADSLVAMGFSREEATLALQRFGNDMDMAIDWLSNGMYNDDDAEFDLIAQAENEPDVHEATVFAEINHQLPAHDHFREGSATVPEMVDSRISSLTAMGFSAVQAEAALRQCNNDVNEALNVLLAQ